MLKHSPKKHDDITPRKKGKYRYYINCYIQNSVKFTLNNISLNDKQVLNISIFLAH